MPDKKLSCIHEDVFMPDQDFPVRAFYFEHERPGGLFGMHWHEDFEITYVTEGAMDLECEGRLLKLKKGDVAIINPNELHSCPHVEVPLKLYCMIFDVEILKSRFFDKSESKYIHPILNNGILFENFLGGHKIIAQDVMAACRELADQDKGYELAIKALILNILVILLRGHVVRFLSPSERETKIKNNGRIRAATDFILGHYTEPMTIEEIADAVFVSKYYLCKLFKKNLGLTVVDYINHVRMTEAKKLLLETDAAISQVACQVGLSDFNYFSRLYKRKYGETPTQTRHSRITKTDKSK